MTPQQKYAFDLSGYLVIDDYLNPQDLEALDAAWPERMARRDVSFAWGGAWMSLLNFGRVKPLLQTMLGRGFRVDHAFMLSEAFQGQKGRMHHQSHMVDQGVIYQCRKNRPFTTLLTLSIALSDIPAGGGGFCCVPGSHKSNFDLPEGYIETLHHPHMVQLPQKRGSAILFTEALTHGTYPLGHEQPRRSILIRLTPGGISYRQSPVQADVEHGPPTHGRADCLAEPMRRDLMSDEQWRLVMRQPYFVDDCGKARE